MPTLDDIWNSAGGSAAPATAPASMDALWDQSKPSQDKGTFLHPIRPTGTGLAAAGERILQYPGLIAGKLADAFMSGPKLMGDVAAGRVEPISREGVERATDVAVNFSAAAPQRAGIATAAKAARGAAPSREALFDEADRLYGELRKKDVPLPKEHVEQFSQDVREALNDRGFYKEDQPATFRAVERLRNPVGEHSTAKEVYAARTSLSNAIRDNPGKSEAAAAELALNHFDDYLSNVPGFSETAQRARSSTRAARQSERVGNATERGELNAATSQRGGVLDAKLKDRIKALYLNDKVPKTPQEAELMKEIVYGNNINKIAGLIARLGPTHLSGWGTAAAADLHGGAGLATITLAIGALAQRISERATSGKIQQLDELIRRNSPLGRQPAQPQRVVTPPTSAGLSPAAGSAFAQPDDALGPQSLNHEPPPRSFLDTAKDFAHGGISEALQKRGMQPEWMKAGDFLHSEAANAALGIVSPLKAGAIADLAQELHSALTDSAKFETAFSKLKDLTKAEVEAVAHAYSKGRERWPTKREALQSIRDTFGYRAYQDVKMKQVEKAGYGGF